MPITARAQQTPLVEDPRVLAFIERMQTEYGFVPAQLNTLFSRITINKKVLALAGVTTATTTPPPKVYWREYQKRRLTPENIQRGVRFMREHHKALMQTEEQYGVPAAIITAIIGVETRYGSYLGNFPVAEALATLAFSHPTRGAEFEDELLNFLLYVRDAKKDPLSINGSYAGAFGIPQFLPSSIRLYAVDFDGDGKINLFVVADAVGSIGSFLQSFGWRRDIGITYPATVAATTAAQLVANNAAAGYTPIFTPSQLQDHGVRVQAETLPSQDLLVFIDLENRYDTEYRVGTDNFYALTRYNKSFKYAAVVTDLATAIAAAAINYRIVWKIWATE